MNIWDFLSEHQVLAVILSLIWGGAVVLVAEDICCVIARKKSEK